MRVHRTILFLTGGQSDTITLHLQNSFVAHDIIMAFYGKSTNVGNPPERLHILETIVCCDFWNLNLVAECNKAECLDVPEEGLEMLIDFFN
jgi:hypothetical protein